MGVGYFGFCWCSRCGQIYHSKAYAGLGKERELGRWDSILEQKFSAGQIMLLPRSHHESAFCLSCSLMCSFSAGDGVGSPFCKFKSS